MRLGSRVVYELATLLLVGAGFAKGVQIAWAHRHDVLGSDALAAELGGPLPVALPRSPTQPIPHELDGPREIHLTDENTWSFQGVPDAWLTAPLLEGAPLKKVKFNRGGSSVSLRLDFTNGARCSFKPEQLNDQTVPRKEIASYRMDRMLGLGGVSPSIPFTVLQHDIVAKMDPESRGLLGRVLKEARWDRTGHATGEAQWWIPVITPATFRGDRLDYDAGALKWWSALTIGHAITDGEKDFLRQISNMLAFDLLTDNSDRFSGGNALMSQDGKLLYFMDNTFSFHRNLKGALKLQKFIHRVQRFSRVFIERVRGLDEDSLAREMARDVVPYRSVLTAEELHDLMARRQYLLDYVDSLIKEHGEEQVLVFP